MPLNDTSPTTTANAATNVYRAVAYVRLSKATTTSLDASREVSLDTQEAGCRRAIAAVGGAVVAVESDIQSGDRLDRPGLWRAIDRVRSGEANAIVVYALDRFGRDQVQQGVVIHELRRAGGTLLSATENLDTGPLGDFLRSVYGFAGALELAKIRERVTRSLDARFRQAGRYKPGRRPLYGYQRIGTGAEATYAIDPDEAAVVERIFRERATGASIRAIIAGLRREAIPSPTGGATWGTAAIRDILDREVYATGLHRHWTTQIVRDADGVATAAPRPRDEQFVVAFPPFLDPALVDAARATSARNTWRSRRNDRPAEVGILRYGFARCAACGRALSVLTSATRRPRYACTASGDYRRPCAAPATIILDDLDARAWWWVQSIIESPERAAGWRVVAHDPVADPATRHALAEAEEQVAALDRQMAGLIGNLGLLTGVAATMAAETINGLNAEIEAARARRDRLAADAARTAPARQAIVPTDALNAAIARALDAMRAADPDPDGTHRITLDLGDAVKRVTLPTSWKARQAALAALDVTVTVTQEQAAGPRWVAEMRLPGDVRLRGMWSEGHGGAVNYLSTSQG